MRPKSSSIRSNLGKKHKAKKRVFPNHESMSMRSSDNNSLHSNNALRGAANFQISNRDVKYSGYNKSHKNGRLSSASNGHPQYGHIQRMGQATRKENENFLNHSTQDDKNMPALQCTTN